MHVKQLIIYTAALLLLTGNFCLTAARDEYQGARAETLRERIVIPESQARQESETERPITLKRAIAIALEKNRTLRQAYEDMGIAADDKAIARSLLLPFITAGYAYDRSYRQPAIRFGEDPATPVIFFREKEFQRAEAQLMLTIWDFGRSLGIYSQAGLGRDIADLLYERTRQQVVFQVVNAYFNVLRARRGQMIAEESLHQAQEHLKMAESFEKYGVVDRNDVLQAKVQVAEIRQMLIKAKNAVELSTSALNNVLGLNVNLTTGVVDDTLIVPFLLSLPECLQLAVDNRPEFKLVQKNIRIEEKGIQVARAAFLPRIYVAGTYNWSDDEYQRFAVKGGRLHRDNWAGEIGIQLDLFSGGKKVAEYYKARKKLAKAEEKAKQICDGITLEVKSAFLALGEARERIEVAEEAVAQAEENLRLINNKYREKVATSTDVIDAETLLTRNKQNYYTAVYDYIVGLAELECAVGTALR